MKRSQKLHEAKAILNQGIGRLTTQIENLGLSQNDIRELKPLLSVIIEVHHTLDDILEKLILEVKNEKSEFN